MSARALGSPQILITNAEQRSVLASCRSLATAGYRVSAIAFTDRAAAHSSRYCDERLHMTDPAVDAERFMGELADRLRRGRYAALIPGSDTALLAISSMRDRVEAFTRTGLPAPGVVERSLDREVLAAAAAAAGLAAPRSVRCAGVEEAIEAAHALGLPVLVKSIRTALEVDGTVAQGYPSCMVDTEHELADAVADSGDECLVQATEHGDPYSFGGIMIGGRLVALAMSHYRRTWPPGAGYAAFAETIDPPHSLERMVETLMNEIGWEGIFELELIRTAPDRFVPIDLNPRPYGSLALTVSAGAPLPAIWCRWLLEGTLDSRVGGVPVRARAGYRYRWEDADLRNVAWRLRRGRLMDALRTALPRRRVTHAYFRIRDPLPLAVRWMDIVSNRVSPSDSPDTANNMAPAADPGEPLEARGDPADAAPATGRSAAGRNETPAGQ